MPLILGWLIFFPKVYMLQLKLPSHSLKPNCCERSEQSLQQNFGNLAGILLCKLYEIYAPDSKIKGMPRLPEKCLILLCRALKNRDEEPPSRNTNEYSPYKLLLLLNPGTIRQAI